MKDSVSLYNLTRNYSEVRLLDLIFFIYAGKTSMQSIQTGMHYICNAKKILRWKQILGSYFSLEILNPNI